VDRGIVQVFVNTTSSFGHRLITEDLCQNDGVCIVDYMSHTTFHSIPSEMGTSISVVCSELFGALLGIVVDRRTKLNMVGPGIVDANKRA
jgi:hypothetical protein